MRKALFADVETTGLDPKTDKITEICVALVGWEPPDPELLSGLAPVSAKQAADLDALRKICDRSTYKVLDVYSSMNDPGMPIHPKVTELTGITAEHVSGRKFSQAMLRYMAKQCEFAVAWNSPFDAKFVDPVLGDAAIPWVDAQRAIDWSSRGAKYEKMDYVVPVVGRFINPFPHSAVGDVLSMVRLVAPLLHLVAPEEGASPEPAAPDVWLTLDLGRDRNDELKAAGFRWNGEQRKWLLRVTAAHAQRRIEELYHTTGRRPAVVNGL